MGNDDKILGIQYINKDLKCKHYFPNRQRVMDTTYFSLSLTFVVLSTSLYVAYLWNKQKRKGEASLPPGQKGLPFIGETLDFLKFGQGGNPEKFISDRMKKFSDKVFRTSLMGENMVVLCGASGNKCVFTGDNKYVTPWSPETLTKVLVSPENIHHGMKHFSREGRKVTNEFLKPELLQKKFVSVMDGMSKQHIEKNWVGQQQVLVFELAKKYTFNLACRLFLSLDDPKRVAHLESLFHGITAGIVTVPLNLPGTPFYRAIKSARVFRKEVGSIIRQRKLDVLDKKIDVNESSKDMLSHMLLSTYDQDGQFPSDMVIADMVLGFLVAGHDTASAAITFMVKFLAELPHIYNQVLEEQMEILKNKKEGEVLNWEDIQKMKYTWSVAFETMRLAPPAQGTFREVTTDFNYAGFTIPKGWKTYWSVHSTNKNPEFFEKPEEFDPTRFQDGGPPPFTFVPFGGGNHICPGREYARVEILVFIHNLVTRFHFEKVLPNEKIVYTIGAIPVNGLPIRLHPRNTQSS